MEFPRFKKRLKGILSSVGRVVSTSKKIILSAGLLTVASGSGGAEPKVPADHAFRLCCKNYFRC